MVGEISPLQQLLLADAGLGRKRLAPLGGACGFQQCVGGANADRFQLGSGISADAVNLVEGICHDARYKVLTQNEGSSELAEARRPRDDLAHVFRSDFVATKTKKFTRDVLNLADAQSQCHQPAADRHQPAAHQSGQPGTALGSCDRGFRARDSVDQYLHFVGWTFAAKEPEHDAEGFFSDSTVDAGLYGQLSNQFVHIAPPQPVIAGPNVYRPSILIACDANYK